MCSVCDKNVGVNSIFCDICSRWVHRQCAKLNNYELQYYGSISRLVSSDWYCCRLSVLLQLSHLADLMMMNLTYFII